MRRLWLPYILFLHHMPGMRKKEFINPDKKKPG